MYSVRDKPTRWEQKAWQSDKNYLPKLQGTCPHCNKKGHKIAECQTKKCEDVAQPQQDKQVVPPERQCYNQKLVCNDCGYVGHSARACRHRKKKPPHSETTPTTNRNQKKTAAFVRIPNEPYNVSLQPMHYTKPKKQTFHPLALQNKQTRYIQKAKPSIHKKFVKCANYFTSKSSCGTKFIQSADSDYRFATTDKCVSYRGIYNKEDSHNDSGSHNKYHSMPTSSQSGGRQITTSTKKRTSAPATKEAKTQLSYTQSTVSDNQIDNNAMTRTKKPLPKRTIRKTKNLKTDYWHLP